MTPPDFRALCAELVAWAEKTSAHYYAPPDVLTRARAALAAKSDGPAVPESREPASVVGESSDVEQVAQQVFTAMRFSSATSPAPPEWVPGGNSLMQDHARDVARAVLTRWGRPAPQPVPVSERLPGPEDCDEEGRCWLRSKYQPDGPTWRLACLASIGTKALWFHYAEWLPAHALPLPEEVEG